MSVKVTWLKREKKKKKEPHLPVDIILLTEANSMNVL